MNTSVDPEQNFRFGGHQSFPLRTAWFPKAAQAIASGCDVFSDPIEGVIQLGLGKNMVEALRVWVEAYGIAVRSDGIWTLTELGDSLFGAGGYDRFLEDERTLWLLHWQIATLSSNPFFGWELLINRWSERFFTPSQAVAAFIGEAERSERKLSPVSARQHFDVWLHTYLAGRDGKGEEGIDSPLASLGLVMRAGDRDTLSGRREPVYAFDLEAKPSISNALFEYCLHDWWNRALEFEETVPLSMLAFAHASPGRVFRLPESDVTRRVGEIAERAEAAIEVIESANQYMLRRRIRPDTGGLLAEIYEPATARELAHA